MTSGSTQGGPFPARTAVPLGLAFAVAAGLGAWRALAGRAPAEGVPPHAWPPVAGEPYPDLELPDPRGAGASPGRAASPTRLSSLRGKVLVVLPIHMGSIACQAWAGGHRAGGFAGVRPQPDLSSVEELLDLHARVLWQSEPDLVLVHLLLLAPSGDRPPTVEEGAAWARHFDLERARNAAVLVGDARYVNATTRSLVHGFHVVDRRGVLRFDATGWAPRHRPCEDALAGVPALLAER